MGKAKSILKLRNHHWDITADVVRIATNDVKPAFRVDVYSGNDLKRSQDFTSIRLALTAACDIVGE